MASNPPMASVSHFASRRCQSIARRLFGVRTRSVGKGASTPGNIMALVNADDPNDVSTYEYGPFGEPLAASGTFAADNPFRFSTKYTDAETDLLYFGYRYYNPSTGRWINRDPIEEVVFSFPSSYDVGLTSFVLGNRRMKEFTRPDLMPGSSPYNQVPKIVRSEYSHNLYVMVDNQPAQRVDLLGLAKCHCGPDITGDLARIRSQIFGDWNTWSIWTRIAKCAAGRFNTYNGWDIHPLAPGYASVGKFPPLDGPCKETAMVNGKCYSQNAINYVMWGQIGVLCNNNFNTVYGTAWWYKWGQNASEAMGWVEAGYWGLENGSYQTLEHGACRPCGKTYKGLWYVWN